MITLHPAGATDFSTLGFGSLSEYISGVVIEEINGQLEMSCSYPTTGKRYNDIKLRSIICAKSNPYSKPQPFRIYSISKPINRIVTISACHLSYDLSDYPVNEFKANSASEALIKLKDNAQIQHPFTFSTNVTETGEINVEEPRTTRYVLGNNIATAYRGEYEFDKFHVSLVQSRGENRGVSIRYGKNMLDVDQEENISNVYTGVYPYWNGTNTETQEKVMVRLSEKIVKVDGNFDFTRILPLDMGEYFTEQPTEEQLRAKTLQYISTNNIGVPKVSLEVSFIEQKIMLGDIVLVEFDEVGINTNARCIKTTYNIATDRYDKVELGDPKSNLATAISSNNKSTASQITQQKNEVVNIKNTIVQNGAENKEWIEANFAKLINGFIDMGQIKDLSIVTSMIMNAAITVAKIQGSFMDSLVSEQGKLRTTHIGSLKTINFEDSSVTSEKIENLSVGTDKLKPLAVTVDKLGNSSVTTDKLGPNSVTTGKINPGAVTNEKLATNSITIDKITQSTVDTLSYNISELILSTITKSDVGLGLVNNWNASSLITANSETEYSTTSMVAKVLKELESAESALNESLVPSATMSDTIMYIALQIIKGNLIYTNVVTKYPSYKSDIDVILTDKGREDLIQ